MKKHVIALAVGAAVAIPAFAQNVSVYGVIGQSVDQVETSGVAQTSMSSRDPLNSSRLGVKGTEDLGGGMKLSFTLEGDINPQDGSGDASGGLTFDRAAFVELDTGMGFAIQAGKIANSTKRIDGAASAGTNMFDMADLRYSSDTAGSVGLTSKMGAVSVWAHHSNDIAPASSATTNNRQGGASETGFGAGVAVSGVDLKIAQTQRGAGTETVGTASGSIAGATLTALVAKTDSGGNASIKTGNTQLGIVYPVSGLNLRASVGRHTHDTNTSEYKYMGVMVEKPLSKRTSVYAGYSDKDVDNGVTGDQTVSTLGITHSF